MSSKGIVNFYALLEVGEDAEDDDIKKSYRRLVLKWHPDKNPSDRDKAEEQIRLINTAYATLSNPTKREKYDLQRCAVNNKNKGMAPRKPKVSPKISLPKEFMLQPLGHPEKFLRYSGKKTAVVGRQDVEVKFKEFFETAKFSLWWVPEVNNMCRVRALGSKADGDRRGAGAGLAGGLNLSFRTAANTESEVILGAARKGKRSENVDFIIKESPEYDGAYRFETGCRRGHYLAFVPPAELRVVPLLSEEEGRVLDFMLVDFSASIKFKDLNEVLQLLAEPKRGTWMPVSELRDSKEVASYFKKVMKLTEVWAAEDFAAYFEGHWVDWDYKAASNEVRLRPLDERLGEVLRSSHLADDVSVAVLTAGEELSKTPLAGILRAIHVLADAKKEAAKKGKSQEEGDVERMKLLKMMPDALLEAQKGIEEETDVVIGQVTPKDLIHGAERVPELLCEPILPNTLAHRKEAVKLLLELVITRLQKNETLDAKPKALSFEELMPLLCSLSRELGDQGSLAGGAASLSRGLHENGRGGWKHPSESPLLGLGRRCGRGCDSLGRGRLPPRAPGGRLGLASAPLLDAAFGRGHGHADQQRCFAWVVEADPGPLGAAILTASHQRDHGSLGLHRSCSVEWKSLGGRQCFFFCSSSEPKSLPSCLPRRHRHELQGLDILGA